jgi:alkylation response protein AidB-like acyl-CoA dehydrogenase
MNTSTSQAESPHATRPATPPRPDTAPRHLSPYPADWIAAARILADEFRQGAVARDQAATRPVAEIRRLRESGLVNLLYPSELGGGGGSLRDAAHSVLEIAKADGSVGALLGFHFYNSLVPLMLDYHGGNDAAVRRAATERWQWGNVTQYVNKDFVARTHPEGGFVVSGTKKWNTGTPLSEVTTVLAVHPDRDRYLYATIPTSRAGLTFHDDWDQIGLRGADSSTITFDDVRILPDEVLNWSHGGGQTGALPLWASFGAVFYSAVYLGSTLGALEAARRYATTDKRQATLPGAQVTADDVLVQAAFGEYWISAQAALAYFDGTIATLQDAWDRRDTLTEEDRGQIALDTLGLRTFTSQVALEVTARIFEFGGGRTTAQVLNFDRYWRDVRTLASHDPEVLARRLIGRHALTQEALIFPGHFK